MKFVQVGSVSNSKKNMLYTSLIWSNAENSLLGIRVWKQALVFAGVKEVLTQSVHWRP